jgi:hypothetical protein
MIYLLSGLVVDKEEADAKESVLVVVETEATGKVMHLGPRLHQAMISVYIDPGEADPSIKVVLSALNPGLISEPHTRYKMLSIDHPHQQRIHMKKKSES